MQQNEGPYLDAEAARSCTRLRKASYRALTGGSDDGRLLATLWSNRSRNVRCSAKRLSLAAASLDLRRCDSRACIIRGSANMARNSEGVSALTVPSTATAAPVWLPPDPAARVLERLRLYEYAGALDAAS